jgi:PAS domain S-box-containing protein
MVLSQMSSSLCCETILDQISTIALQIQQGVDLAEILESAVAGVRQLLAVDRVLVYRWFPDSEKGVAAESADPAWSPAVGQLDLDASVAAAWVEQYGYPFTHGAERSSIRHLTDWKLAVDRPSALAALIIPILSQGNLAGLLIVAPSQNQSEWQALAVQLGQQIALQLGTALQQAALQQQLRQLQTAPLERASPASNSSLDSVIEVQPHFSESQQPDEALRQSEHRNRAIVSAIPDLMFRVGSDGIYRGYVTCPRPTDLLPKDLDPVGKSMADLLAPELADRQMEALRRALSTGELQIYEQQIQIDDRLQDEEVRVVQSGSDEVLFMIRDISEAKQSQVERQQAEAALQASEQCYRAIVEEQTELVVRWSLDRKLLFINTAYCRFFGKTREELLGQDFFVLVPESEHEARCQALSQMIRAFSPAQPVATKDAWVQDLAGQPRFYRWIDRGIFDAQGNLVEIQSVGHDLTDRKQIEDALRDSEARQAALIRALPDLVMRIDQAGTYLDFLATKNFRVIGDTGDFVGSKVKDSLPPDLAERRMVAIAAALRTGEIQFYEQNIWVSEGFQIEEVRVVPYQENEVLLVVRDVSVRKRAESALCQRVEQEQALNQVVQAIRQSFDLETIFATATVEIAQLLEADRSAIVQYLPDRGCWKHLAEYRRSPAIPTTLGLEVSDQSNSISDQLKTLKVVQIPDSNTVADQVNQQFVELFPGAWLLVPLVVGQSLWGSFSMFRFEQVQPEQVQSEPAKAWTEDQVRLAQATADQLAIAIQQSQLYRQVQQLNTNLELQVQERTFQLQQSLSFEALLKRITDKVRDSLDEQQILQTVVQELVQGLHIECCDTGLYNADHTTSTIAYEFTKSLSPAQGLSFEITHSAHPEVYPALFQGQTCQFNNLLEKPLRPDHKLLTTLACPILDDQGILGDLWLFRQSDQVFDEQEVRLVKQVANQCAIGLRQSRLYQAAQQQVQELERLNRLKDDFLNTVSHELRTPLSSIKLATQMLEISLEPLGVLASESSLISRYLQILHEESQREIELINDLLDLARLEDETDGLSLTPLEVQYFIPHLVEPFFERARNQQQQLEVQVPETLPPIKTYLPYLDRILTELLHNACKYTPAGETIALSVQLTPRGLEICIRNSGVEIPAAERDRIFDKFYRIPNNDPWKHDGTGLGLALVKKLAGQLGAEIRVESGRGETRFVLELAW